MKKLLAIVTLLITTLAIAEPFRLDFRTTESNDLFVSFDENQWELVSRETGWSLYLARGESETVKSMVTLYTMVVYDEPKQNDVTSDLIHRIFNVGLVDCTKQRIFLLNDFFTSVDNKVVWISKYEFGEFISDTQTGTPRNKVYKLLCEGKHI